MENHNPYASPYTVAAAEPDARAAFIRRTYLHLAGAIALFVGLEFLLLQAPVSESFVRWCFGGQFNWLIVLGVFMGGSFLADRWAHSETGVGIQYAGLGLLVVLWAVMFLPMFAIAQMQTGDLSIVGKAGITTLGLLAGLTGVVLVTGKDFNFLGAFLAVGSMIALGTIVAGIVFSFNLGLFFSFAMVVLAAGSILYTTSNMIHRYRTDQHVAAALGLFSGVAMMFWYILRIFMSRR